MTYAEAKAEKEKLEKEYKIASDAIGRFPKNALGLTPDAVKKSPAYREARGNYAVALVRLQDFNERFFKAFAEEYRAERLARRA